VKEVGIRIRVGAAGLENVDALVRQLKAAGVQTGELEADAQDLGAELQRLGRQQTLIDQFAKVKREAADSATALQQAQQRTRELALALRDAEAPTKAQATAFERSRTATRDAAQALQDNRLKLQQLRGALTDSGLASDQLAAAQVRVNVQTATTTQRVQNLRGELQRQVTSYGETGAAAGASAAQQTAAARAVGGALDQLKGDLAQLRNLAGLALGGSLVGSLARDVSQTADEFANLAARVRLATGEGEPFEQAFSGVQEIALATNSALETTGTLFARVLQAGREVGLTQQQALALTQSINQAVQLSGGSAESSNASITQLIQGLQSGVLRGEEFNSVMEQSPRLARALADGLGVTTGKLREMAGQGQLTSAAVIGALQGQSQALQAEFALLPATVGRALTNISTQWTVYVGEVDKANGVSAKAAGIIAAIADNLGTLATVATTAGQAWLAYKALDLAGTFLRQAAAVQAAAAATAQQTAVLAANTVATQGNTAAKSANAAAGTAAASATAAGNAASALSLGLLGRLAGALGLAVTGAALFGDIAVRAFKGAGTWIGEGIAKLQGYRDSSEEVLALQKAQEKAVAEQAQAQAALSQQLERTREAAFGMTAESRKLVGEFGELRAKGDSAAEALGKVAKNLQLENVTGIKAAGVALDELARKGEISAEQVRSAWTQALNGRDLAVFEAAARAAFAGSEQGARRFAGAMDGAVSESIRRTGVDMAELKSGISAAATSAINDFDLLIRNVETLGKQGVDTGRVLRASLDKALEAATTEKAVQQVIGRLEELGRSGLVSGTKVAEGLEIARKKADELKAGISSTDEALRLFGLKSKAELDKLADNFKQAWDRIRFDATLTLEQKQKAFKQFAEAAIAANGGVVTSEISLQASQLKVQIEVDKTGKAFVKGMGEAGAAVDDTRKRVDELGARVNAAGERINQLASGIRAAGLSDPFSSAGLAERNAGVQSVLGPSKIGGPEFSTGFQYTPPDASGDWIFDVDEFNRRGGSAGGFSNDQARIFWKRASAQPTIGANNPAANARAAQPAQAAPAPAATGDSYTVNVTIGGKQYGIGAGNKASADQLIAALEEAYRAGGGG